MPPSTASPQLGEPSCSTPATQTVASLPAPAAGQGASIQRSARISSIGTAASGIEFEGTSTHRKPSGASLGGDTGEKGARDTGCLLAASAAEKPFLTAEYSTQYVSRSPATAAANGKSSPNASKPILNPPQEGEHGIQPVTAAAGTGQGAGTLQERRA